MAKAEPQLYKPADACRMAEVAPYVLRYWETEFPALSEGKEKGGARLYTAREVQIITRIRQLLYDEGFTVAGAKKRLESEIQEGRFDGAGEKGAVSKAAPSVDVSAPQAPQRPRLEDVPLRPEPPSPRPVATPKLEPPPVPVAASAPAPPPRLAEPAGFAERKTVIKELKEIVRLLERPKKR